MGERVLFVAALCLLAVSLGHVQARSVEKRQDPTIDDVHPDDNITLLSLEDAVENYNLGGGTSKRQMPLPDGIVVVYVLLATCTHVTFWLSDFTDEFDGAVMQIQYGTDPDAMPVTWTDVGQNPFDLFLHPLWAIELGAYSPCTTVYINAQLEKDGETKYLGGFNVSTDCPCDCTTCIGDPHFTTFQHKRFDFNGPCSYILTHTCEQASHTLEIVVNNQYVRPNVESIKSATVTADGHTIEFLDDGTVKVDGLTLVDSTFVTDDANIAIVVTGQHVKMAFSVTAKWWMLWIKNPQTGRNEINFEIEDNSVLVEKQCGMLGPKYTDNKQHPFEGYIMPNGDTTLDTTEYGNSWVVAGSCP